MLTGGGRRSGNKQQKMRNDNGIVYGQSWSSGDVIGGQRRVFCVFLCDRPLIRARAVMLDLNAPSLRFARNGNDMGEAYGASEV